MATNKYDGSITEQELKQLEHGDIIAAAEQDRGWYLQPEWRFPTAEARDTAIANDFLTKVNACDYFAFAADVRNDERLQYLRHEARALLLHVMKELDKRSNFTSRGIKLIVNSLHRCDDLQNDLANGDGWYRVAPVGTSAHAAGAAFDINVRTHYVKYPNEAGWMGTWREEVSDRYAPDVIEQLAELLSELAETGICNVIIENEVNGTDYCPTCFHICVSPDAFLFLSPEG